MSARSFPIKLTMPNFSTKLVGAWVNMLSAGYANLDRGPPHVGIIDPRDFRYHDSLIGKVMRWTLLALRSKAYSRTRGQPLQKSLGYSIPTSGNQEKSPDKRERIMLATHVGRRMCLIRSGKPIHPRSSIYCPTRLSSWHQATNRLLVFRTSFSFACPIFHLAAAERMGRPPEKMNSRSKGWMGTVNIVNSVTNRL
jgi:hypothetical protein